MLPVAVGLSILPRLSLDYYLLSSNDNGGLFGPLKGPYALGESCHVLLDR